MQEEFAGLANYASHVQSPPSTDNTAKRGGCCVGYSTCMTITSLGIQKICGTYTT